LVYFDDFIRLQLKYLPDEAQAVVHYLENSYKLSTQKFGYGMEICKPEFKTGNPHFFKLSVRSRRTTQIKKAATKAASIFAD
ncbi:MAG: hypothetical protein OEW97_06765, partial [Gammaproteobacteria bacterium]|nr:hypothetical protein [Gammaproteobacteria bacterium]